MISAQSDSKNDGSAFVRRATLDDAKDIHRAHMQSIQEVCAKDHSPEEILAWGHRPYHEEQRYSAIKSDFVWVVECHGTVEGYGHLKIFEKDGIKQGHIFGLYLTAKAIGKSLGKTIFGEMMTEIKNAQVKKITLQSTITAHDFYKKMGFLDDGVQKKLVINGTAVRCFPMKMEFNS